MEKWICIITRLLPHYESSLNIIEAWLPNHIWFIQCIWITLSSNDQQSREEGIIETVCKWRFGITEFTLCNYTFATQCY